jgi:hypothetical protein
VTDLELIGAALLALALLAAVRARRIAPPPPLRTRVRVRVTRHPQALEVEISGARGAALSFHGASWEPSVRVLEVSGPLTVIGPRATRRYVLAPEAAGSAVLRGIWEQLTFRELALPVDLGVGEPAPAAAGAEADGRLPVPEALVRSSREKHP